MARIVILVGLTLSCSSHHDEIGVAAAPPPPEVFATAQPAPSAVAVDDRFVYWNNLGHPAVRRMARPADPKGSHSAQGHGHEENLYEGTSELGGRRLVLVGDALYFDEGFTIERIPKTGGVAVVVGTASRMPFAFTADASGAYVATEAIISYPISGASRVLASDSEISDIAVDATHVFWVSRSGVKRVAKAGGPVEVLATGGFRFGRLVVTDRDVYWGDAVLGGIFAVPKAGGRARFVAHGWSLATAALVIDRGAGWMIQGDGELQRIDLEHGTTTTLAYGLTRGGGADHVLGLAVAGADVFVATGGMSMSGTGLRVIDLTGNPDAAPLPELTFDGEILRLPTSPAGAVVSDERAPRIAMVWFDGATVTVQDPANAVRWINELSESIVPAVTAGQVALHLVALTDDDVTEAIARARASYVDNAIRARLGAKVRIAITIARSPPHGDHGGVEVALDPDDLAATMAPK